MPAAPQKPTPLPWWLQGGSEECPHCGQRYHLEAERRCEACDAPGCLHCLTDAGTCPECQGEHEES